MPAIQNLRGSLTPTDRNMRNSTDSTLATQLPEDESIKINGRIAKPPVSIRWTPPAKDGPKPGVIGTPGGITDLEGQSNWKEPTVRYQSAQSSTFPWRRFISKILNSFLNSGKSHLIPPGPDLIPANIVPTTSPELMTLRTARPLEV